MLSPRSYNGWAFILNKECLPFEIPSRQYKDKTIISYALSPKDSSGTLYQVAVKELWGKGSGAALRAFLSKDTVENKSYLKDRLKDLQYNITPGDWEIINERYVDSPLTVLYNMDLQLDGSSLIYLNPFIEKLQSSNPFKNVKRRYPIELDLKPDIQYLFKMTIPKGYNLEENIESKNILFKDGKMAYQQTVDFDAVKNILFLNYTLKTNSFDFPLEDYSEFRNFYEQIITEQSRQIVLKRIK